MDIFNKSIYLFIYLLDKINIFIKTSIYYYITTVENECKHYLYIYIYFYIIIITNCRFFFQNIYAIYIGLQS